MQGIKLQDAENKSFNFCLQSEIACYSLNHSVYHSVYMALMKPTTQVVSTYSDVLVTLIYSILLYSTSVTTLFSSHALPLPLAWPALLHRPDFEAFKFPEGTCIVTTFFLILRSRCFSLLGDIFSRLFVSEVRVKECLGVGTHDKPISGNCSDS